MDTILILEDDSAIRNTAAHNLRGDYLVEEAADCASARLILEHAPVSLCLVDVNLPDGNGFDFCRRLREVSLIPVIFLTVNDREDDIIRGLDCGGDDYVTKPFSMRELRYRIKAQLRRSHLTGIPAGRGTDISTLSGGFRELSGPGRELKSGVYRMNTEKNEFTAGNHKVELTRTEYRIMELLMRRPGCLVTREFILGQIWDDRGNYVENNTLSVNVSRLRRKLRKYVKTDRIQTISGVGYRLLEAEEQE